MGASSSVASNPAATAAQGSIELAQDEGWNLQSKQIKRKMVPSMSTNKINKQPKPDIVQNSLEDAKKAAKDILEIYPNFKETFECLDDATASIKNPNSNPQDTADILDDCEKLFFQENDTKMHNAFGDYLALINFVEYGVKKYVSILKQGDIEYLKDEIYNAYNSNKPENVTQYQLKLLLNIRSILWNFSDSSVLLGEQVAKSGYFHYLFEDLKHLQQKTEYDVKYSAIFDSGIGILHNCGKSCSAETRECYRKEDAVKNLIPFLQTKHTSVKVLILLTLSNIISEEENNLLLADKDVFENLIQLIKLAQKDSGRRYDGFSVEELVSGLKGLAKNDENKTYLMKKGALPMFRDIIETNHDDSEVLQATEAIRVLSFAKQNKEDIKNDSRLMKLLKELAKKPKEKIKNAASGILWNIKGDKEKIQIANTGGHIMISYQWADQKKLLQIQQALSNNGYSIWIDINDMEGSTLQAMADAVEKSSVVLVCMSEKYKESSNCRTEAEYAFTLKKTIIPLMMQRGYKPDGWLGMILGAKLFVDFSGKYAYEDTLNKLIKQLGDDGRLQEIISDSVDGPIPVIKSVPLQAARGNSSNQWSKTDVSRWLEKINLNRNKSLLSLTGEQLSFLKKLSNRAPEYFYSYIETKLGLFQLEDMMKFSNAIDQL